MAKESRKNSAKSSLVATKKAHIDPRKGKPAMKNRKAFEEYARFIALPTDEAIKIYGYATDSAFIDAHKLDKNALTRWKSMEELWTMRDLTMQGLKRYTAQVMEAMRNGALKGDTAAAKLHLQYIEKWNPKMELAVDIDLTGGDEDFG